MHTVQSAARAWFVVSKTKFIPLAVAAAAAMGAAAPLHAAGYYYWIGRAGADNKYETAANWNASGTPYATPNLDPSPELYITSEIIDYPYKTTIDMSNGASIYKMTLAFDSRRNLGFTFIGDTSTHPVTLGAGGLRMSSGAKNTFQGWLTLGADQKWIFEGRGSLKFTDGVYVGFRTLTLEVDENTTIDYSFNGHGSIIKTGAMDLRLASYSTNDGMFQVDAGTATLANSQALISSLLYVSKTGGKVLFDTTAVPSKEFSIGGLIGDGAINLTNGARITLSGMRYPGDYNFNGSLTGTGGFGMNGNDNFYLGGDFSYADVTKINFGKMVVGYGGKIRNHAGILISRGTLTLDGGAINVSTDAGANPVVNAGTEPGIGTINILSGTLNSSETNLGTAQYSRGVVNHSGGTHNTSKLVVGQGTGGIGEYTLSQPYDFSSATLNATATIVGQDGTGTFTHNGGTFNGSSMILGHNSGGVGNYLLNGGTLTVDSQTIARAGKGTFTQTGGTNSAKRITIASDNGGAGVYQLNGGTLRAESIVGGAGNSSFNFNGGQLIASADASDLFSNVTNVNVQSGGANIDTNGKNVIISRVLQHDVTSGAPVIDGGLTKTGEGTLTLASGANYTGDTRVQAGTLVVSGNTTAGNFIVAGGAAAEFKGALLTQAYNSLTADTGGTISFSGGTSVAGGYLDGTGTYRFGTGGASLRGSTINNGANVEIKDGDATFKNVTNSGRINVATGRTLTWNGGTGFGGSLNVSGTVNANGWTGNGVTQINRSGALNNSKTNLELLAGSRTYIGAADAPGGTLSTAAGTSIELSGLLVNNGTVSGKLNINYGGTAMGAGKFDEIVVNRGGAFHPGNSPDITTGIATTLNAGSTFEFTITDALGGPGAAGHSQLQLSDMLTINGGSSASNLITIAIQSILPNDMPGMMTSFDAQQNYSWTMITTANGISGFDASYFRIDTTHLLNAASGAFSVSSDGANLLLNYTASVPEPTSLAMIAAGGVLLMRRRKSA